MPTSKTKIKTIFPIVETTTSFVAADGCFAIVAAHSVAHQLDLYHVTAIRRTGRLLWHARCYLSLRVPHPSRTLQRDLPNFNPVLSPSILDRIKTGKNSLRDRDRLSKLSSTASVRRGVFRFASARKDRAGTVRFPRDLKARSGDSASRRASSPRSAARRGRTAFSPPLPACAAPPPGPGAAAGRARSTARCQAPRRTAGTP